jgi:hypothetical protein
VAELGDRDGLTAQARARLLTIGEVRVEDLHRDLAIEHAVPGAVHHGHAAVPDFVEHIVFIDLLAGEGWHGRRGPLSETTRAAANSGLACALVGTVYPVP